MTRRQDRSRSAGPSILISAVEPSGDLLGAALMAAIQKTDSGTEFFGCGGQSMSEAGLASLFPIDALSVFGPVDALMAAPRAYSCARKLARAAAQHKPEAAVLIDSWVFSRMAAAAIRKASPSTTLIKYVAPQVWASRPTRAKTLARLFDGVLTLFEFEPHWFEQEGAKARFVGNSTFQRASDEKGDGAAFRARHNLGDAPLLVVALGSRRGEVLRLADPFREACARVREVEPRLKICITAAPAVFEETKRTAQTFPSPTHVVGPEERYDAFAAATAALAASGTVSSELAIHEAPLVVGYKVSSLAAFYLRRVITTDHVTLLNIAAGREVIPEFLQENCTGEALAEALIPLICNPEARNAQSAAVKKALPALGVSGPAAADLAADTVLEWIGVDRH
ncbi:MAG: lipid-A-disaccharide synthase [Pseudomonadota bacterium]